MVAVAIIYPVQSEALFNASFQWITSHLSTMTLYAVSGFLLFTLLVMLSPVGKIRLGKDDDEPAFGYISWMAMLFSAGMGIGLLFNGVSEPVLHYLNLPEAKPFLLDGSGNIAANKAQVQTFFHWGLSGWAIYAIIGLALAYGHYRKGRKLSIRAALIPLFGDRIKGKWGDVIDILAVVGTLFGVATSLAFGVAQINAGLNHVLDIPISKEIQLGLIFGITLIATISVVTGVDKGVKLLSEINLVFAAILLVFVAIVLGPVFVGESYTNNLYNYFTNLPFLSAQKADAGYIDWLGDWTLMYWGWWIAWSPFVGLFIARISKGRTIGEFLFGVLFVPSLLTFLWMTVFGDGAISLIEAGNTELAQVVQSDVTLSLFSFLENLPGGTFSSIAALIVVFFFFVTSSDSGSYVIDMITAGGDPNPPTHQKVYWAFMEGIVAAVLLYMGGMKALQVAMINVSLPFTLVLILMTVSLSKELYQEYHELVADTELEIEPEEECA